MIDPTRPGDPTQKPLSPAASQTGAAKVTAARAASGDASEREQDTVDVELAADIVETAMAETKSIDSNRLEELKALVASGEYKVDAESLADRILDDASR